LSGDIIFDDDGDKKQLFVVMASRSYNTDRGRFMLRCGKPE